MGTSHASHGGNDRRPRGVGAVHPPWFQVRLSIGYSVNAAGIWGTGVTRNISRGAVEFVPAERTVLVGDGLDYVLVFPGHAGKAGAVASCRGHVIQADSVVVVTIDQYRLQTAAAAKAARPDQWTRWLMDVCQVPRDERGTAATRAATDLLRV